MSNRITQWQGSRPAPGWPDQLSGLRPTLMTQCLRKLCRICFRRRDNQSNKEADMDSSTVAATFTVQTRSGRLLIGLAFLTTALVAPVQAQTQKPPFSVDGHIVVVGEGTVSVPPDYAQVRSGVTTRAKTAKDAADANSKVMAAVTAALLIPGLRKKTSRHRNFQFGQFTRHRSPGPSQNSLVTASPTRSL